MDKDQASPVEDATEDVTLPVVSDIEKVSDDNLPKGTVHCFPANPKQILIRRVVTVVLMLLCIAGSVYSLTVKPANYYLLFLIGLVFIASALVFIQTFLIAGFRVAVDYEQNEVVLRYMFRKLKIPFEEFDSREGEPDKAQKAIGKLKANASEPQRMYLILDNVHDDACYQTSSYDLASISDFLKLKEEAEQVARAYKGREKFEAEQKALEEQDAEDEAEESEAKEAKAETSINPISEDDTQSDSTEDDAQGDEIV